MNHVIRTRNDACGIIKMLGSFHAGDFCGRRRPLVIRYCGGFNGYVRIHLGRPFTRGLHGLGRRSSRTFPSGAIDFHDLRRDVTRGCGTLHIFHGTALVTAVTVFFIVLVKLVNCATSRIHQHDGRVTVHGIGKTRTSNVLRLLSGSILCITLPTAIVNDMTS